MTESNISLPITGMSCANCAANVERSLKKVPGVVTAAVNYATERVAVAYLPGAVTIE
ncbi:MAG: heavy metal-associated domain-containing protein, partial [Desulfatitalea sp.]